MVILILISQLRIAISPLCSLCHP